PLPGFPTYGYLLAHEGRPVGIILTIFSEVAAGGVTNPRCNLSSWYVLPEYRCYAAMLTSRAMARKDVTYINVTPTLHTLPLVEALGYARYCDGRFIAAAALAPFRLGVRISVATPDAVDTDGLSAFEAAVLIDHARCGCISLICGRGDE